jgi:hypothetical protein
MFNVCEIRLILQIGVPFQSTIWLQVLTSLILPRKTTPSEFCLIRRRRFFIKKLGKMPSKSLIINLLQPYGQTE